MQSDRFKEIISEEFSLPLDKVHGEIVFRELDAWTSLHALLFIAKVNEESGVMISSNDLSKCHVLDDIFQLINQK